MEWCYERARNTNLLPVALYLWHELVQLWLKDLSHLGLDPKDTFVRECHLVNSSLLSRILTGAVCRTVRQRVTLVNETGIEL